MHMLSLSLSLSLWFHDHIERWGVNIKHCDSTSRNGEKFTAHQVTHGNQFTFSLEFQCVAYQDTKSILDINTQMFENLED